MEELYTLPDGSTVDISSYSQLEKMNFLLKNKGAKKSKGGTKSAVVTPKKNQAQQKSTGSTSASGSSASQTFRLPTNEELQKSGKVPPPSETTSRNIVDLDRLYNMVGNTGNKVNKQGVKFATTKGKKEQRDTGYFTAGEGAVDDLIESVENPGNKNNKRRDLKYDIDTIKNKIQLTDSELLNPYLYYSSKNKEVEDNFVDKNYNLKELQTIGVNPDDFDGFLNKKGYKDDFLKKEEQGIYEGTGNATLARYDIGLAKELAKKKMLNMYMEDMQQRDFTRQDLNQDLEITFGVRDKKEIVQKDIFDPIETSKYVEKNFPIITQKLKDRDIENKKIYDESKKGGTDFFSWDTLGKMGKSGWNAVSDRIKQISASAYSALGMEATAEGIRALDEENKFIRPDDRGVSYASGKSLSYKGTNYLVDSKGEIYDADAKIRVTDLFNESEYKNIVEKSKYAPSDWMFSTQGAAVQTSGVMADMLIQAAVTRGVGEFGALASEARVALNGARQTSKFTSLLNDSSQLLKKIPLDRATGYSMIAQGALGYSQGYEDTLKAARDAGINDNDAFKLATSAAQRMAILYSTTGVINPQTKVAENIFGSKNIIKKAIDQYLKVGEKGFVSYIDDIIKSTPRNLVEFAEEGGKEVIQENVQQVGEIGVNRLTNEQAGKKIMNETMSGDDFMNTSILSFVSSGLISKMKMPSIDGVFGPKNDNLDDLRSLSTLAKNKKEFNKIAEGLITEKVFTKEQVDNLKNDVDVYSNNVNKIPKSTSADVAMPIMRELDKVTKLQDQKETLDKAFHPKIDEQIEGIRQNILDIEYANDLKVKNQQILNAIDKGVAKGISMKSFSNDEQLENYLVNEVGIPKSDVSVYSSQGGFALSSTTLKKYSKDPDSIPENSQLIIVNESRTKDAGVVQHEFLHGVLQNTLKENPEAQKLLGRALTTELLKINDSLKSKGLDQSTLPVEYAKRLGAYMDRNTNDKAKAIAKYEIQLAENRKNPSEIARIKAEHNDYMTGLDGVFWEEAIVLYSDALRRGYVNYDEGVFTKLGDVIRRTLQYLGLKDVKFNSGKDVYNFIKDYNNSVETGNWGKALTKMSNQGAKINIKSDTNVNQSKSSVPQKKFSLSDKKSPEQIKKDVNKNYNKDDFAEKINSQRDPALFNILEEYDFIIKGKAKSLRYAYTPDYNELDMIMETKIALIPHIRNFNKEFLEKRKEYKDKLIEKGLDPNSKEFKDKVEEQDEKGYQGKKGIVKENDDLNAWINSQLGNKMKVALNTGNVTNQKSTEDIEGEMFKESRISDGFGGDESYLSDEGDSVFNAEQDFEAEQTKLAVLLSDPVFRFTDEKGNYVNIETIPFGALYITESSDPSVPANKKLKTETDPVKIAELKREIKDLERGLELESKKDITFEEKQELNKLKSFKSFDLSTGNVINTFKALSIEDTPAKIVVDDVAREILSVPNIETLEFRNFKERLSDMSKTMMKRITFETGEGLESFMYNNWDLIYDVINHPVDQVTGESSYASKKLPPTLKEFDEKGNLRKISDITRVKFLQAFYEIEDVVKIIKKYGGKNADKEIQQIGEREINPQTGNRLSANAHFDRRTALRELFGDVMVLQEARRLLRDEDFLNRVAQRNVNLYNSLKDDIIRTKVLNDMAKGKSDIVRFNLAEQEQPRPKKDYITTNPYNMVGDNPMYSLKYDELFSSPSDFVKFSLSDIDEKAPEPSSKFKNFLDKIGLDKINDKQGWVLKALQQSDIQDDDTTVKKLHTLKSAKELNDELEKRLSNLIESMLKPSYENEWVIQEYKEGYIDTMLQRSLDLPEEAIHTPYWNRMKIDEDFRREQLTNVQNEQIVSLNILVTTITSSEFLDGESLLFSRYLFLKDILSNRYYPGGNDNIIKKSIKKSEYRTTIQPIQDYNDSDLLLNVFENYSDVKNIGIGAVYFIKKMSEKPIDFNDNFVQEVDEKNNLYKFFKGEDRDQINSLNTLASYSSKSGYPGSSWCTGASRSMAASQLKEGDFYIIANKNNKIPVLAIRYSENNIVEMAGTREDQNLWPQDYGNIEFAINELPSDNRQLALDQLETAKMLSKLTAEEINSIESEETLQKLKLSKSINIHFEKEIYGKSKIASNNLRKLIAERQIKSGVSLLELYKEGFNIDDDGESNITSELDLEVLNKITEFTNDVVIKVASDDQSDVDFMENVIFPSEDLKLNELTKAGVLEIAIPFFATLEAKKLTEAKMLKVSFERYHENPYLSLPDKINYNIDLTFYDGDPDQSFEITIFDKEVDMSNNNIILYFNEQETDSVILSGAQNSNIIDINGVITDFIDLPKKARKLYIDNIYGKSGSGVKVTGLEELETLNTEWNGFDDISFTKLKKLGNLAITIKEEYEEDFDDVIKAHEIFNIAENVKFLYYDNTGNLKLKTLKSKPEDPIKFSLAEEENGGISEFLQGLNFTQQWVVARDIDKAILSGRSSEIARNATIDDITEKMKKEKDEDKLEELRKKLMQTQQGVTTFKVPSRSKMSDKSTAYFIISKVAEGYNNFEFKVKKNAQGPLTKQVLDAVDVRNKADKEVFRKNSNLEVAMNDIIEENTGIKSSEKFSAETAKNIGKNKGNNEFYLPPQDEDFLGLIYTLASGKGKVGEAQLKFFQDNLLKPYSNAMLNLMKARQTMYKDWKNLIKTKYKGITKLLKEDSGYEGYTIDQAVRVYLWNNARYDIPGLDSKDKFNLIQIVRTNKQLREFAADISLLSKQANGYVEPDANWGLGSIVGDINNVISKSNRKKYLQHWQSNVDKIFSKDNMSKIEAVYGRQYVNALRNMLERMQTGTNRQKGSNDELLNWINGATADVMWWNVRSAALQTLGSINYINTSDNNIIKATKAFLNTPQFIKDFMTIWKSDYSKDRRSGLMNDVAEAEFAQMMNDPRNKSFGDKLKSANYWLLKNGFNATRFMDSFAIALGGASFYRNRIDTYKKQGLSDEEAEAKTMSDFYDVSEQSQQSADVSKISKNQASTKGRLILAFLNTPFQYSRLIKRSVTDLVKGRGSVKNNIAKIVYYAAVQNVIFNMLQNALFSKIFDDDDDEEMSTAEIRAINGALDTLLRGAGLGGVLMSTAKNFIVKWYEKSGDPKGYGDVILELANVSPAIGTKFRQVAKAYKAFEYNKDEIMYKGFSLDNTYAIEALTSLTTARYNIPLDRVYQKFENVKAALSSEYDTWQRIALAMGYSTWNLGIEDGDTEGERENNSNGLKRPGLSRGGLKSPGLK